MQEIGYAAINMTDMPKACEVDCPERPIPPSIGFAGMVSRAPCPVDSEVPGTGWNWIQLIRHGKCMSFLPHEWVITSCEDEHNIRWDIFSDSGCQTLS